MFRPSSRDNGSSRRRPCGVDPAERKDSLERLINYRNTCAKLEYSKKSTDNQLLINAEKKAAMNVLAFQSQTVFPASHLSFQTSAVLLQNKNEEATDKINCKA